MSFRGPLRSPPRLSVSIWEDESHETAIASDDRNLYYQHGEVVVPNEALVRGRHRIFVPLSCGADAFLRAEYSHEQVFVSGLCIEASIVSQSEGSFNKRISRLQGSDPLCGGFFTSGSEPRVHVQSIVAAALSAAKAGERIMVFAKMNGLLAKRVRAAFRAAGQELAVVSGSDRRNPGLPQSILCTFDSRASLNEITAARFAEFDFFVAPSHERSNWALGLGIPMFVVDPPLGSFSPLNRKFLLDAGVAKPIRGRQDALSFGATLSTCRRTGELQRMAEAGWERFNIRGFENIAAMLVSES